MLRDGIITAVRAIRLEHSPAPHPFHEGHSDAAAANWADEIRANPHLFNGPVMLARRPRIEDGLLVATCHIVPYATLLYWLRSKPEGEAVHIFAMAVPVSSDGGVIVGRMGGRTANPGKIYCPSGSFDDEDLADGMFDPEVNMQREVSEETGFDLVSARAQSDYHVMPLDGSIVIFRRYRFEETAEQLLEQGRRHLAAEEDGELDEVMALRRIDAEPMLARHMAPILAWQFGGEGEWRQNRRGVANGL